MAWQVAQEQGLGQLTLRAIAGRVGMRPPSLYGHFNSKDAIYDAMFRQAWEGYEARIEGLEERLPDEPRQALKIIAATIVDYSLEDLARHQLMNVRMIPGFTPSAEAYAPAVRVIERLHATLSRMEITDAAAADLFTALTQGLVDQQWANDPGGSRWRRLLDRVIDMYANEMGLPGPERRSR